MTIDIGNTHTVIGIFKDQKLINHWRITSDLARTEDEIAVVLNSLLEEQEIEKSDLRGGAISSVVPELTPIYRIMCKRYLEIDPLIIGAWNELGLAIKYKDPKAVGADRLCNAVAGKEKYGAPLIIIDFGTATTFDCLDDNGDYLGGIIAPGISTSIDALHRRAAKLPKVDINFPARLIGRTTDESIQSGILFGTTVMIDGLVEKIKLELGENTTVIATGGLAKKIAKQTKSIEHVDVYLSLEGIASIYQKNEKAEDSIG